LLLRFGAVDVEYSLQKPDLGLQMFPCKYVNNFALQLLH